MTDEQLEEFNAWLHETKENYKGGHLAVEFTLDLVINRLNSITLASI